MPHILPEGNEKGRFSQNVDVVSIQIISKYNCSQVQVKVHEKLAPAHLKKGLITLVLDNSCIAISVAWH